MPAADPYPRSMGLVDRLLGRPEGPGSFVAPAPVAGGAIDRSQARWEVPVLEIAYFPTAGDRIDQRATGDVGGSLAEVQAHVARTSEQARAALEAGSTTHHYKNQNPVPNIRYETIGRVEFLEPLPTWNKPGHKVPMTDYNAIMDRVDIASWLDRGVKQVWIWGYHGGVIDLWESNMAGPHGDISNSDRDPTDLPVFDRTYTVYHYNYGRGPSEAVEDHMHQIEALLRHLDPGLFWDRFVGRNGGGRCGWAHFPPNGTRDYDWANTTQVLSDIEDWSPDGGTRSVLDCRRWNSDSLHWFTYWMQNLPGANNGLSWQGQPLNNWWWFVADLDDALARGAKLAGGTVV